MAIKTVVAGGGNWNSAATWSPSGVPTSTDDVVLDSSSGGLALNTTTMACKSIDCTGYTNTLTLTTGTLTVSGNVTFSSGMTITGTGTLLSIGATSNITSNTKIWTGTFRVLNSITATLLDNFTVRSFSYNTGTLNGAYTLYVTKDLSPSTVGSTTLGTATIEMTGASYVNGSVSCTWSGNGLSYIYNPLIINNTNPIIISGTVYIKGNFTKSNTGTVTTTSSTLYITGATSTITSGNIIWNDFKADGTTTITLADDFICNNVTQWGSGASLILNALGSASLKINGTFTVTNSQAIPAGPSGSAKIVIAGSGNLSSTSTGTLKNNLDINTTGSVVLGSTFRYGTGILTYITGAVDATTNNNTLVLTNSTTLNTNGINWNNISIPSGSSTYILSSSLNATGTLTMATSGSQTLTGSAGFSVGTLSITPSASRTVTLTAGNTYTINNALILTGAGSGSNVLTLTSNSSSSRAYFTLIPSATQNVTYTNATRIDSSAGQTIISSGSILINTINWASASFNSGNYLIMF